MANLNNLRAEVKKWTFDKVEISITKYFSVVTGAERFGVDVRPKGQWQRLASVNFPSFDAADGFCLGLMHTYLLCGAQLESVGKPLPDRAEPALAEDANSNTNAAE